MVKIFDWVQSLQTRDYRDNFHGKLVKLKNGFSQAFVFNVIPKTNTKVGYGCLWGVAVEILKKNSKMKNLFENDLLYECVTFHEFGRHIFTWSWISIYSCAGKGIKPSKLFLKSYSCLNFSSWSLHCEPHCKNGPGAKKLATWFLMIKSWKPKHVFFRKWSKKKESSPVQ